MSEEKEKYDERGNLVYYRGPLGMEQWKEYNEDNMCIHYKNSDGREYWVRYTAEGKTIVTHSKEEEFLSREEVSRFKLMEVEE